MHWYPQVSWAPPKELGEPACHKYLVERVSAASPGGSWEMVAEVDELATHMSDKPLPESGPHSYRVTAWNMYGRTTSPVVNGCDVVEKAGSASAATAAASAVGAAAATAATASGKLGSFGYVKAFFSRAIRGSHWIWRMFNSLLMLSLPFIIRLMPAPLLQALLCRAHAHIMYVARLLGFKARVSSGSGSETYGKASPNLAVSRICLADGSLSTGSQLLPEGDRHLSSRYGSRSRLFDDSNDQEHAARAAGDLQPPNGEAAASHPWRNGHAAAPYQRVDSMGRVVAPYQRVDSMGRNVDELQRLLSSNGASPLASKAVSRVQSGGDLLGLQAADSNHSSSNSLAQLAAAGGVPGTLPPPAANGTVPMFLGPALKSRKACAQGGCEKKFDVKNMRERRQKHYCGRCQQVYCLEHTAYSAHGATGDCGQDSRCVCINCFLQVSSHQGLQHLLACMRPAVSFHDAFDRSFNYPTRT